MIRTVEVRAGRTFCCVYASTLVSLTALPMEIYLPPPQKCETVDSYPVHAEERMCENDSEKN